MVLGGFMDVCQDSKCSRLHLTLWKEQLLQHTYIYERLIHDQTNHDDLSSVHTQQNFRSMDGWENVKHKIHLSFEKDNITLIPTRANQASMNLIQPGQISSVSSSPKKIPSEMPEISIKLW